MSADALTRELLHLGALRLCWADWRFLEPGLHVWWGDSRVFRVPVPRAWA